MVYWWWWKRFINNEEGKGVIDYLLIGIVSLTLIIFVFVLFGHYITQFVTSLFQHSLKQGV